MLCMEAAYTILLLQVTFTTVTVMLLLVRWLMGYEDTFPE